MKATAVGIFCVLSLGSLWAQEATGEFSASNRMLESEEKLSIGGYAQVDFNQPLSSGNYTEGELDVHRLVLLFGYKFNERTTFISEVELEHVSEVYVEQAFLNYRISSWLNLRGGLMLVPVGIINEYHEPTTFNGVERPVVDNYIIPSTWREIGIGASGSVPGLGLSYQLYLMNGFLGSDDGKALFSGSSLFRSGRQKGAESVLNSPVVTFKMSYTGIPGLNTGFSGYFGKSQSTAYNGIPSGDDMVKRMADSTVAGIRMLALDARYSYSAFGLRGQLVGGSVSNTDQYNTFHDSDLGSGFLGYYAEISCNLLHFSTGTDQQLIPFVRYEKYDTHFRVVEPIVRNPALNRSNITFGLGWKPATGAVVKLDYQVFLNQSDPTPDHQVNAGIGIWF